MGRKGIGKLAGFGLAKLMTVLTWKDGVGIEFYLPVDDLKKEANTVADVEVTWTKADIPPGCISGTRITLAYLKHKSPLDVNALQLSLARRFSRSIQGQMCITVNDEELPDPTPELIFRYPETGFAEQELPDGNVFRYWYGFAKNVIKSRELRGFSVLVNGKVAQAPPFFFDVEATASGQHSTKYVIGEIEADFIDKGIDDESDVIATDRQEIDWEVEQVAHLRAWGEKQSRKVLAECRDFRGNKVLEDVYEDPDLSRRIALLDTTSQGQIRDFLKTLSLREGDDDTLKLADSLVRAYEFRQFHDVIEEIREASEDPDQLAKFLLTLNDWKTLESRAVLEVIRGRLDIIDNFESLIVNNSAETAHRVGDTNMHDAIGRFPWLLDPDWQVLAEEKTITKQLAEWGASDIPEEERGRYDFLALGNGSKLVIVEIKRSGHPVTYAELSRLVGYKERLALSRPEITVVLVYGGTLAISDSEQEVWSKAPDRELRCWSEVFLKSRSHYERYRAVLESDIRHPDFLLAARELSETRQVIGGKSFYRDQASRAAGLGVQNSDYGSGGQSGQPDGSDRP